MKTNSSTDTYTFNKLLLDNVSDIIVITDLEYNVQFWNSEAEKFYGIAAADAIGKNMGSLVNFTFYGTTIEEARIALEQNKIWQGEVSFQDQQQNTFFFLQTVKFATDKEGNATGILSIGYNITDRKLAEEKLKESEEFYRTLTAESLDVTLLLNASGEITFASGGVKRLLGYDTAELVGSSGFQYIHSEDLSWAVQSFEREVEENPEIKFIVVRILHKNGHWLWCMIRGHNLLQHPTVKSIVVYLHDDTPRKKASEALKESERKFRTLIKDLQIGMVLQNAAGEIEMTNAVTCRMFDIEEEAVLGGKIWELYEDVIHEDGARFLLAERPSFRAIQTRKLVKDVVMGVWHKQRKERLWIMVNADPVLDEAGELVQIISSFTDITERKKLEKKSFAEKISYQRQVAQAAIDGQERERLEIGKELHDNIGQQLTTIKLFLDLAKSTADDATHEMINMALRGVSDVINEIRAISRSLVPPTLKDLGFIDSVNDLIESLRSTQSISIELDYYEFDEDQLPENKKLALYRIIQEQLNNIIKHAEATKVFISLSCKADNILLQVKDNGKGFDPTSKRKGLGLKNMTNRAELFGGKMEIASAPGEGCQIKIWIPHTFVSTAIES